MGLQPRSCSSNTSSRCRCTLMQVRPLNLCGVKIMRQAFPQQSHAAENMLNPARPRVVIIGGGFTGLAAARTLEKAAAEVILIDRSNHHLFQPLLYQVATAALSPADIASATRAMFSKSSNVSVVMDEVTGIDAGQRQVMARKSGIISYD
ncbi:FAD-dependent oxidoreductase [Phaeobacter inhibens]|nr:FAD-dependent oxidoreductase [Phaeobacter inhibens]